MDLNDGGADLRQISNNILQANSLYPLPPRRVSMSRVAKAP
jgi:hypothetical protein